MEWAHSQDLTLSRFLTKAQSTNSRPFIRAFSSNLYILVIQNQFVADEVNAFKNQS